MEGKPAEVPEEHGGPAPMETGDPGQRRTLDVDTVRELWSKTYNTRGNRTGRNLSLLSPGHRLPGFHPAHRGDRGVHRPVRAPDQALRNAADGDPRHRPGRQRHPDGLDHDDGLQEVSAHAHLRQHQAHPARGRPDHRAARLFRPVGRYLQRHPLLQGAATAGSCARSSARGRSNGQAQIARRADVPRRTAGPSRRPRTPPWPARSASSPGRPRAWGWRPSGGLPAPARTSSWSAATPRRPRRARESSLAQYGVPVDVVIADFSDLATVRARGRAPA